MTHVRESCTNVESEIYSDSVELKETDDCFFDVHKTTLPKRQRTCPEMDLRSIRSDPQSASTKQFKTDSPSDLVYVNFFFLGVK